jgi:XTP/dITP diphosphohydrolase
MSHELIFATHNQNKVKEVKALLPDWISLKSLDELNFTAEIPETGETLEQNALGKAYHIYTHFGKDCFAEDSGLETDALDGAPGVYSARYSGPEADSERNMDLLLGNMRNHLNRKARFKTVFALIFDGKKWEFEGSVEGSILSERRGASGFGYDPVFLPDGHVKTFAEMSLEEKNRISHRALALQKMIDFLEEQSADRILSFREDAEEVMPKSAALETGEEDTAGLE